MKHDWNSLENYLSIHDKILRIYAKFMLQPKHYALITRTDFFYILECKDIRLRTYKGNTVRVDIYKEIEVDPSNKSKQRARTSGYSYGANRPHPNGAPLIRYCSPHFDHNKYHHKHDYTKTPPTIVEVSQDEWPHVGEFFNEVLQNY